MQKELEKWLVLKNWSKNLTNGYYLTQHGVERLSGRLRRDTGIKYKNNKNNNISHLSAGFYGYRETENE